MGYEHELNFKVTDVNLFMQEIGKLPNCTIEKDHWHFLITDNDSEGQVEEYFRVNENGFEYFNPWSTPGQAYFTVVKLAFKFGLLPLDETELRASIIETAKKLNNVEYVCCPYGLSYATTYDPDSYFAVFITSEKNHKDVEMEFSKVVGPSHFISVETLNSKTLLDYKGQHELIFSKSGVNPEGFIEKSIRRIRDFIS